MTIASHDENILGSEKHYFWWLIFNKIENYNKLKMRVMALQLFIIVQDRDKANIFQTIIIILTYEHNSLHMFIFIIHASVIRDDDD